MIDEEESRMYLQSRPEQSCPKAQYVFDDAIKKVIKTPLFIIKSQGRLRLLHECIERLANGFSIVGFGKNDRPCACTYCSKRVAFSKSSSADRHRIATLLGVDCLHKYVLLSK